MPDDGHRYELIDGTLIVTPAPSCSPTSSSPGVPTFTDRDLPVAPLLAVEALSPSTRHIDLSLKRARSEAAGAASFWVVDPDDPSLTVWELEERRYVERAHVAGNESYEATAPFAVTIIPDGLFD